MNYSKHRLYKLILYYQETRNPSQDLFVSPFVYAFISIIHFCTFRRGALHDF